jgi:hypothetical protein
MRRSCGCGWQCPLAGPRGRGELRRPSLLEHGVAYRASGGGAWILDLVRSSWTGIREAELHADEDKEAATCHLLERGLGWAQRAFDKLILPATTVSSAVVSQPGK